VSSFQFPLEIPVSRVAEWRCVRLSQRLLAEVPQRPYRVSSGVGVRGRNCSGLKSLKGLKASHTDAVSDSDRDNDSDGQTVTGRR
jgi:hypothetical protein